MGEKATRPSVAMWPYEGRDIDYKVSNQKNTVMAASLSNNPVFKISVLWMLFPAVWFS